MTIRTLKNELANCKKGDVIFINALHLSVNAIEYLQNEIKNNHIKPIESDVKGMFTESGYNKIMNGDAIAPQMEYIIQ